MVIGITGCKNIKQFNPVLYLQFAEPNFKLFCMENGFQKCEISEIVTGSAGGVDESVKFWCDVLKYNLHILAPDAEDESIEFEAIRKIIDYSDIILFVSDGISPLTDYAVTCSMELRKPLYLLCEYSNKTVEK